MQNLKLISITALIALLIGYGAGYKSAAQPAKVTEQVKDIDTSKTDKDTHTVTTITAVKEPSGEEKTTTVIDHTSATRTNSTDDKRSSTTIEVPTAKTHVSVMAGHLPANPGPDFGLAVSRDLLGPVNVGAYVFKSGTFGVTIGISF